MSFADQGFEQRLEQLMAHIQEARDEVENAEGVIASWTGDDPGEIRGNVMRVNAGRRALRHLEASARLLIEHFCANTHPDLEPPDLELCQGEYTPAYSFMSFGKPGRRRCASQPVVIAIEAAPGKDGECGAMSLCEECRQALIVKLGAQGFRFIELPGKDSK